MKYAVKILVVDDTIVNLKIIQKFLEPKGYIVVCAANGQEAVDQFISEQPDIILMDVMMPVKDGYTATKEIKALAGEHWVPVIFLSAKSTAEDQVEGIKLGGDDYLTKPVDLCVLEAKLMAMLRILDMQHQLNSATKKLQMFAEKATEEIDLAKNLMSKMAKRKENVRDDCVRIFTEAAEEISGDIALTYQHKSERDSGADNSEEPRNEKTVLGKQYFMLADATGHGLAAAISLIPLSQLFYRLASKNETISEIVLKINERLQSILPTDRFVAASIGLIDPKKNTVEVWNGANPAPQLINAKGQLIHTFNESNFSLGIVKNDIFNAEAEVYHYDENCELLFFSDGVIDAQNTAGESFSNDGIQRSLSSGLAVNQLMFDKIKTDLNDFRNHDNKVDDICILSARCIMA